MKCKPKHVEDAEKLSQSQSSLYGNEHQTDMIIIARFVSGFLISNPIDAIKKNELKKLESGLKTIKTILRSIIERIIYLTKISGLNTENYAVLHDMESHSQNTMNFLRTKVDFALSVKNLQRNVFMLTMTMRVAQELKSHVGNVFGGYSALDVMHFLETHLTQKKFYNQLSTT